MRHSWPCLRFTCLADWSQNAAQLGGECLPIRWSLSEDEAYTNSPDYGSQAQPDRGRSIPSLPNIQQHRLRLAGQAVLVSAPVPGNRRPRSDTDCL